MPATETQPRRYFTDVFGPGPHRIDHDLGTPEAVVVVRDYLTTEAVPAHVEITDENSLIVGLGYFHSTPGNSRWVSYPDRPCQVMVLG